MQDEVSRDFQVEMQVRSFPALDSRMLDKAFTAEDAERARYESKQDFIPTQKSEMRGALEKGMAQGMAKGDGAGYRAY